VAPASVATDAWAEVSAGAQNIGEHRRQQVHAAVAPLRERESQCAKDGVAGMLE
jgi:hypothetical protein